jgi:hypothetical protein
LERFICRLKMAHRKTTGRASCQGYIVRYGAYVALINLSLEAVLLLEEKTIQLRRLI